MDEGVHLVSALSWLALLEFMSLDLYGLWKTTFRTKITELFIHKVVKEGQSEFYIQSVPEALARAVKQTRSESPDRPSLWAPFIQFGT